MRCPIAILAAGDSSRLGQPKQLVVFSGKTLLRRATETAFGVKMPGWETPVGVVLGANATACQATLEGLTVAVLQNPDWPEGMASSVRRATQWAAEQRADALLLLLCDQPFVTADLLVKILDAFAESGQPLVASDYGGGVRGVPVLVGSRFFDELSALRGDRGAQVVLRRHADTVATVPFPGGRFDLDTPADLARLREFTRQP